MLLMCSILYPLQRWPNVAPILDVGKIFPTPIDQTRSVNCTLFLKQKCDMLLFLFILQIFYQFYFLSNVFFIKFICYLLFLKWPQRPYYGENLQFRWCPLILIPIHLQLCGIFPQLRMWRRHINLCTRQIFTLNGSWSLHW